MSSRANLVSHQPGCVRQHGIPNQRRDDREGLRNVDAGAEEDLEEVTETGKRNIADELSDDRNPQLECIPLRAPAWRSNPEPEADNPDNESRQPNPPI